jgi:gluconate 2-dehydrogenase gamma chain
MMRWPFGPLAAVSERPATGRDANSDYAFFTASDVAFISAAADRLIPADDFPSASEAGVVTYIDRQLAGDFGRGTGMYLAPPHRDGQTQQGYQLGLTPAAVYRESLDALAAHPAGSAFPRQGGEQQDVFLRELESGAWMLGRVPSAVFFETLLANVIEGYFADPLYGGNRDMVGWRMVGFPGAYAHYTQWVGRHNLRFDRPPLSIAMQVAVDHGDHGGRPPGASRTR